MSTKEDPSDPRGASGQSDADGHANGFVLCNPVCRSGREADVQLALIHRYVGTREELVQATFDHLGRHLAQDVLARPLEGHGFDADSTMGRWTRIASYLAISGTPLSEAPPFNPVVAIAETIQDAYGLDATAARVRGAQVVASALGWRLFERYLIAAGDLDDLPVDALRADLTAAHRRLGATPWPSPPDPPRRDSWD